MNEKIIQIISGNGKYATVKGPIEGKEGELTVSIDLYGLTNTGEILLLTVDDYGSVTPINNICEIVR